MIIFNGPKQNQKETMNRVGVNAVCVHQRQCMERAVHQAVSVNDHTCFGQIAHLPDALYHNEGAIQIKRPPTRAAKRYQISV
jgi:hypothetical protein